MNQIEIERKITKSKNISLTVYQNGRVVLKHPAKISKILLENFIAEKQNWILNKLQKIPKDIPKNLKFEDGETIHIFGKIAKIHLNDKKTFYDPMNGLYIKYEKNEILRQKKAKHYLKSLLLSKIEPLIQKFESNLKTKVNKISIRTMRSLWGSCNSKNYISINLSLVHCPDYIIDYIILHEISHTIEHNHSQKFWNIVKSQNPNFKIAEKWLKEYGKKYIYYLN
ncbi:MAG: M48 family metallopeptidase [Leptospira sp.]|uniref:M48 family metallopeptidase n=1 Tax=Leptospira sp. TaxID=178 RepID=UPI0025C54EC5|nr:SprT family zinc-dependent metalloprotease [Leptospira sp.]MBL0953993.1 M48 family metallopeptidase [Leptospira sp.]